jgi:hypothetical protein
MVTHTEAQTVDCPKCERKAGYPCADLRGHNRHTVIADAVKGGLIGARDRMQPHAERVAAVLWPEDFNHDG